MVDAQPPSNSQHQRSFLSVKPIGFKPSDSNFSWQRQPRRIQWKHSQVQNGVMSFTLSGEYIKGALNSQFFFGAVVMCNSSRRRRRSWLWWNPTFLTRQRFQPCSQIGPFPQVGVKIENTWNHRLAKVLLHTFFSRTTPLTKILRNLQNTLHPKQIPLNPTPVSKTNWRKIKVKKLPKLPTQPVLNNPQLGGGCFNPFSKSTCLV